MNISTPPAKAHPALDVGRGPGGQGMAMGLGIVARGRVGIALGLQQAHEGQHGIGHEHQGRAIALQGFERVAGGLGVQHDAPGVQGTAPPAREAVKKASRPGANNSGRHTAASTGALASPRSTGPRSPALRGATE